MKKGRPEPQLYRFEDTTVFNSYNGDSEKVQIVGQDEEKLEQKLE